jgi:hypothetical protein
VEKTSISSAKLMPPARSFQLKSFRRRALGYQLGQQPGGFEGASPRLQGRRGNARDDFRDVVVDLPWSTPRLAVGPSDVGGKSVMPRAGALADDVNDAADALSPTE